MNLKYTLGLALFLTISFAKAQEIPEEKRAFFSKMLYATNKPILQKENYIYKEEDFIESDFFNETNSTEEINRCAKIILETGKLEIKEMYGDNYLIFNSELSEKFKGQITDQLD
ncbi:hypothetical protein, partial [Xanthovirga aplysinae]|uniref:hypothetical protein n=1 Tax=Xanthovirga aplysinae TaxID=2529853 RepID=UPI0012BD0BF9